jgi:medium-chain acyl-[acyl-carrier-protein] hydrolase
LPHLVRMFQEAAMVNTVRLKISSPELMAESGLSWILRRQRIECFELPRMGQQVSVVTAPSGFARQLQTFRDFHIVNDAGETLAVASTQWLLMDVNSRRLRPIPDHIALLSQFLAPAAAHLNQPSGKIAPPEEPSATTSSKVAYYQLDFNEHLTNPVFPELMLEPLGADFLQAHRPTLADIDFRAEARYGDEVTAVIEPTGDGFQHALLRGEELLGTMKTSWAPTEG